MDMNLPAGRPLPESDNVFIDLCPLDEPFAVEWAVPIDDPSDADVSARPG
jgi:hypothetical protein